MFGTLGSWLQLLALSTHTHWLRVSSRSITTTQPFGICGHALRIRIAPPADHTFILSLSRDEIQPQNNLSLCPLSGATLHTLEEPEASTYPLPTSAELPGGDMRVVLYDLLHNPGNDSWVPLCATGSPPCAHTDQLLCPVASHPFQLLHSLPPFLGKGGYALSASSQPRFPGELELLSSRSGPGMLSPEATGRVPESLLEFFTLELWFRQVWMNPVLEAHERESNSVFCSPILALFVTIADTLRFSLRDTTLEGPKFDPSVWNHVAAVADGSDMILLLNGREVRRCVSPQTHLASRRKDFVFDLHHNPLRVLFDLRLDELRLWTVARSEQEVRRTMHRSLLPDEIYSNALLLYYTFDSRSGIDQTGNGFDLELGAPDRLAPGFAPSGCPIVGGPFVVELTLPHRTSLSNQSGLDVREPLRLPRGDRGDTSGWSPPVCVPRMALATLPACCNFFLDGVPLAIGDKFPGDPVPTRLTGSLRPGFTGGSGLYNFTFHFVVSDCGGGDDAPGNETFDSSRTELLLLWEGAVELKLISPGRPGEPGNVLRCDENEYVRGPGNVTLVGDAHTLELWVLLGFPRSTLDSIIEIGSLQLALGTDLMLRASVENFVTTFVQASAAVGRLLQLWMHVAVVLHTTHVEGRHWLSVDLFINGQLTSHDGAHVPHSMFSGDSNLVELCGTVYHDARLFMVLDEVRLWNHARTPAQIQAWMDGGPFLFRTGDGNHTKGMVFYYSFDGPETGSGVVHDESGNHYSIPYLSALPSFIVPCATPVGSTYLHAPTLHVLEKRDQTYTLTRNAVDFVAPGFIVTQLPDQALGTLFIVPAAAITDGTSQADDGRLPPGQQAAPSLIPLEAHTPLSPGQEEVVFRPRLGGVVRGNFSYVLKDSFGITTESVTVTIQVTCDEGKEPKAGRCVPCMPGRFWVNTSKQPVCQPCARNTFSVKPGQLHCRICPPGRFQTTPGSVSCSECRAHKFPAPFCYDPTASKSVELVVMVVAVLSFVVCVASIVGVIRYRLHQVILVSNRNILLTVLVGCLCLTLAAPLVLSNFTFSVCVTEYVLVSLGSMLIFAAFAADHWRLAQAFLRHTLHRSRCRLSLLLAMMLALDLLLCILRIGTRPSIYITVSSACHYLNPGDANAFFLAQIGLRLVLGTYSFVQALRLRNIPTVYLQSGIALASQLMLSTSLLALPLATTLEFWAKRFLMLAMCYVCVLVSLAFVIIPKFVAIWRPQSESVGGSPPRQRQRPSIRYLGELQREATAKWACLSQTVVEFKESTKLARQDIHRLKKECMQLQWEIEYCQSALQPLDGRSTNQQDGDSPATLGPSGGPDQADSMGESFFSPHPSTHQPRSGLSVTTPETDSPTSVLQMLQADNEKRKEAIRANSDLTSRRVLRPAVPRPPHNNSVNFHTET